MEILQLVRVRRQQWRVLSIRAYDDCRLLTLAAGNRLAQVLAPFDDVEPVKEQRAPLRVGSSQWRRACRAVIAADTPPGCLRTAADARIDLLPHQLEPALAILRGAASRVLLADDVGLGKTVQAGLIVAELLARGCADRVLILTPAGLRDQWVSELRDRFSVTARLADAAGLRALIATLPLGVNPWRTIPIAIASIDYVKRPEVLPAVLDALWDIVVLDEAHASVGDSDRRAAVAAIASRAAYVVLATATPHNGDDAAFDDLCAIGALPRSDAGRPDGLLIFRRTRQAVYGQDSRRIHVLHVRRSATERHMDDALERYRRAVAAEHGERALALSVLDKRALSSPWSLAQSVDRRLAALALPKPDQPVQLGLPLDDADGELTADDAPPLWPADLALADVTEDRRLLTAVAAAAKTAALHDDSKLRCLRTLLRRIRESAIVFTEYRDTAGHLVSALGRPALLLHGGMDRHERARVIDSFHERPQSILIATDAAGQGLNLHHASRLVINVELPWNPMRLEQRIGRVDRIGQRRRVHAIHLVARATGEDAILARLKHRVRLARNRVDAADPLDTNLPPPRSADAAAVTSEYSAAVCAEVGRLVTTRGINRARTTAATGEAPIRPLLLVVRRRRFRVALRDRTLLIYRLLSEDSDGRAAESRVIGVLVRRGVETGLGAALIPHDLLDGWRRRVEGVAGPFFDARERREREIAALLAAAHEPLFQPALFDRRADRARADVTSARAQLLEDLRLRAAAVARQRPVAEPKALLVLVARP